MSVTIVRDLIIGQGTPKICVPIVGSTKQQIQREIGSIIEAKADLVEWRVDLYEHVASLENVQQMLSWMKEQLGNCPLVFTFRTVDEGGTTPINRDEYVGLLRCAVQSHMVDLVDVELFVGDETIKSIIEFAHEHGVKVIVSNHDFEKTPSKDELISRIRKMWQLGADLPKVAVMPQCREDVLTLLSATESVTREEAKSPIISMSMGRDGMISRLCGEFFGSSITFASSGKTSAPGQMDVSDVQTILSIIHEYKK